MKICKFILFAATLSTSFVTANVFATDLMDVYEKAFANDPQFKAARATWLANKETLAINRADLLPTLSARGSLARGRAESDDVRRYNNSSGYSLTLTQPIFNFGSWANVWWAQAVAKGAKATFMSAEEDLLQRTAEAYFNVLQAKDVLSYAKANKASLEHLFTQAKHKYDVGLTRIVDLEESRRDYYKAISEEIGAANGLNDKFEKLNEITGTRYDNLVSVKSDFPLLSPKPADIDAWVKAAEQQNFDLIAARYGAIAAREQVKVKNAGHMPTLDAQGSYGYKNSDGYNFSDGTKDAQVGLGLSLPIFQGGKVLASARQADYEYQVKLSTQEQKHRSVVSETRQTYLGILSNISKIEADLQAIKSAQSSLRANRAGYTVGTDTMSDILTAQTKLYEAQKTFAEDEYAYIKLLLKLKALTGILDTNDLKQINSWLEKPSVTSQAPVSVKQAAKNKVPQSHPKIKSKSGKIVNTKVEVKNITNNESSPDSKIVVFDAQKVESTVPGSNVSTTSAATITTEDISTINVNQ